MNKDNLFKYLRKQNVLILLDLLESAYDEMTINQRQAVFSKIEVKIPLKQIDGNTLLKEIEKFYLDSMEGKYYAPFAINSKKFSHIPEKTEEWFAILADYLKQSAQLSKQGKHSMAIECFCILYKLIGAMEEGEEIVFADELGSWMIPGDEKKFIEAYLTSLAAVRPPAEFTEAALPLIRRDIYNSFAHKTYSSAIRVANEKQKSYLRAEVKRQNIRTS